jgi:tight adherence protein C
MFDDLVQLAISNLPIVAGTMVFLIAVLGYFGITAVTGGASTAGGMSRRMSRSKSPDAKSSNRDKKEKSESKERLTQAFARMGENLSSDTDVHQMSRVRQMLIHAGYFSPRAVQVLYGIRVLIALLLPVVFAVIYPIVTRAFDVPSIVLGGIVLGIVGLYLPVIILYFKANGRKEQARDGFPDALDLLVVCVEAGLSLDQAIERVSKEIGRAHPSLGENFRIMSNELRAGRTRAEALRNMGERVGIEEVKSFVTLLVQSEELGTSVSETLRVYVDEMREKRILRAEEKAQALPAKLSIPLVLFIFPVLLIVILLPVLIRIAGVMG